VNIRVWVILSWYWFRVYLCPQYQVHSHLVKFGNNNPNNLKRRLEKTMTYTCEVCNSWDSLVSIATRLWAGRPRNRSSIPGRREDSFCCPQRPYQLWGTHGPHILSNGYQLAGAERGGGGGWCVKLNGHSHFLPMLRMCQLYLRFPIRLHDVVFGQALG
jgi:hypothetical protein